MNISKKIIKDSHESYNTGLQSLLLSYMLTDHESFAVSQNIIRAEYFDGPLRPAARYILEYTEKHRCAPTFEMIKGITNVTIEPFPNFGSHTEWYMENIEGFCRFKALEAVIIDGVDLLESGQGAEVERRVKEAQQISLTRDLGTDYFDNPYERLERLKDKSNYISTGWKALDHKLYGGFTRKALYLFAGPSGSGKSLWMQNLALNWCGSGLNVVYITLELSEDLCCLRLDSMVSGKATKDIFPNLKEISYVVQKARMENKGNLLIKKFPEAGTTCNDLRGYLKELELKTGKKVDAVIVDYLDLLYPNNKRIDPTNLFVREKAVAEELRAISFDFDCLMVSASQLNRQAIEAQEYDHSHIAGSIGKISTCDCLFGIFTSQAMRDRGIYQLQFLKTRSSSAVGSKIEMAYDPICLRIKDVDGVEDNIKTLTTEELKQQMADSKAKVSEVVDTVSSPTENTPEVSKRQNVLALMNRIRKTNET